MTAEWYAAAAGSRPPRNFFAAAPITARNRRRAFLTQQTAGICRADTRPFSI